MGDEQNNSIAPYDGSIQAGSKCAQSLIEAVSKHLEPWRLRRLLKAEAAGKTLTTDAEVDRIIRIAEAESAAEQIRALATLKIQEWDRQQHNRATVVEESFQYLPNSEPDRSVDPGWTNVLFHASDDAYEPEIITLFAKLLAGEVAKPGTFSRRTISIVRDMSTDDARLLDKASSLFWFFDPPQAGAFIPSFVAIQLPHLLNFDEVVTLSDMGMLHEDVRVTPASGSILRYGSRRFIVGSQVNRGIPSFTVSRPAQELFRVCNPKVDSDYLNQSLVFFRFPSNALEIMELVP